jgi:hypothetical protein
VVLSTKNKEDRDMSASNIRRIFGIVIAAVMAASVVPQSWAASDRTGKFAPASWPDETIYRPECRMVQADGSWRYCGPLDRDQ